VPERVITVTAKYARCRTLGHSWDPIPVTTPPEFGVAIDLRCTECHTVRRDIVRRYDGKLLQRWYHHPDDYKYEGERLLRNEWRAMWIGGLPAKFVKAGDEDD